MINLFPGEKIITTSNANVVTLTTHRVCYEEKSGSRLNYQHIMLEHISSTEVAGTNYVWMLVVAIIFLLWTVFNAGSEYKQDETIMTGAATIIFVILYFYTKRYFISISSSSCKIRINASKMSIEGISHFLNKVEETQNERAKYLARIN